MLRTLSYWVIGFHALEVRTSANKYALFCTRQVQGGQCFAKCINHALLAAEMKI